MFFVASEAHIYKRLNSIFYCKMIQRVVKKCVFSAYKKILLFAAKYWTFYM